MAEESSGIATDSETEDVRSKLPEFPPEENEDLSLKEKARTIVSFAGVGFLLHCLYTIIISGSEDLLAGTYIPTTAVVIGHVGPMVLINFSCPWFMQKLSYFLRVFIVFGFMASGLAVIVFVENPYVKITGVSLNAIAHALGEITFLALAAFYGELAVTSFAAGSGAGILIGPLYYLGLTSWACLSPQKAMIIASGFSILLLLCYYILNKDRVKSHAIAATYATSAEKSSHYKSVPTNNGKRDFWRLTCGEKIRAAWGIFPFMAALCISYASQFLTIQAVFTTMSFPSSPFPPRDHFVYYVVLNGLGEFISRSYLGILTWFKPELARKIVIKHTWILSLGLLALFALSICASWFRFFESVAMVLLIAFLVGSLSGAVFSNTLLWISEESEPRYKEFCLGLVTAGEASGALIGSLIGLKLEPVLRVHCERFVRKDMKAHCFTRRDKRLWTMAVCKGKVINSPVKLK